MAENPTLHCLNCGTQFQGNFCYACGQKATVQKLTWKTLAEELIHFFTHAEHSFLYTTRKLIKDPAFIIKEYLDGKRVKVHKPITFFLIWAAFAKLAAGGYQYATESLKLYRFEKAAPMLRMVWQGYRNPSVAGMENIITLLIEGPVFVAVGWIMFRNSKYSFVEKWVAIVYALAFGSMISMLMWILAFVMSLLHTPVTLGFMNDLFFVGYFLTAYWIIFKFERFYQPKNTLIKHSAIAFLLAFFAIYSSDLIRYLLYMTFQ